MTKSTPENLLEQLNWRYAVKKFDSSKKISPELWDALEKSLVLTPSSYGLQPWKFLIIMDTELREKLRVHSWNQSQVTDSSHYVVFCTRKTVTEADIDHYVELMSRVNNVPLEKLAGFRKGLAGDVITGPRSKWVTEWCARQAYIALGNFMTSAAVLGVDTCPMEGFEPEKYNEVLGLNATPFQTIVACAAGYRSPEDGASQRKKVRFPVNEIVSRL